VAAMAAMSWRRNQRRAAMQRNGSKCGDKQPSAAAWRQHLWHQHVAWRGGNGVTAYVA